jgi:dihydroorotase
MTELLIKGASLVTAGDEAGALAAGTQDILIKDGRYADPDQSTADATVIDADGLTAIPGLIDLHTHLREPGREDAETVDTGSRAAARGGFAAVLAMANTDPVTDTAEAAEHIRTLGAKAGHAQVFPIGAVSKGLRGEELAELGLMARSGVTMFSDDGNCVSDARLMRRALEYIRPFDGVIAQHSQDPRLAGKDACCHEGEVSGRLGLAGWPSAAEATVIARDAELAKLTDSRVHVCHVSTAESVDVLRWAKKRGIKITAEVTPHHLLLTTAEVEGYDPTYKVNPPLRPDEDVAALRGALADGTIDAVATDHAPHARHDKEHAFGEAAFGMVGLETALGVVIETMINTGAVELPTVVQRTSAAPARIARLGADLGVAPAYGRTANLTVIDLHRRTRVDRESSASLGRNNPYHGRELPDPVELTLSAGQISYQR